MLTKEQRLKATSHYTVDPTAGWIGFDFDGTLVTHEHPAIGSLVPLMVDLLVKYIVKGHRVKIMTARGGDPKEVQKVKNFLVSEGLPPLEVTNKKDYQMLLLYDDRARQVITDTGVVVGVPPKV
jgi:hypothetical protein